MFRRSNTLLVRRTITSLRRHSFAISRSIFSPSHCHSSAGASPLTSTTTTSTTPVSKLLFHLTLNEFQPTSILLLHGLLSSHLEWTYVTPHLSSYHLLLPDLPAHSSSSRITNFTIPSAASIFASSLQSHARSTPCHVVGLSAGGFVALELAKARPELVQSLFVTGVGGFAGRRWLMAMAPYVLFPMVRLQSVLPDSLNDYMLRRMGIQMPQGLQEDIYANAKFSMLKQAYTSIVDYGDGVPLPMRTLAVAGERQDDVEGTRRLGQVLRGGCDESRAFVVNGAVHAWDLQWPELFAEGIKAWIERRELPEEFKELR